MKKGIESLKAAVKKDTEKYENCFNENGCDHEFHRMVPETNPGLIAMGITKSCISVSKCTHKYCDKYKWVIERAKHYAEKNGKTHEEIIEIWENDRDYWYMNYYQDCNQPLSGQRNREKQIEKISERIAELENKIEVYETISNSLIKDHQQSVKSDISVIIQIFKKELNEKQTKIKLFKISCFTS